MVLYKLKDFDPDYQDAAGRDDIVGLDYTDKEAGRFRYLVVDRG